MTIIEGNLRTDNAKYGIVVARFMNLSMQNFCQEH